MSGRKSRLTPKEVESIRSLYRVSKMSMQRLAERFGVSTTTISKAIDRKPPYESRT